MVRRMRTQQPALAVWCMLWSSVALVCVGHKPASASYQATLSPPQDPANTMSDQSPFPCVVTTPSEAFWQKLTSALGAGGEVVLPSSPGYAEATSLWNHLVAPRQPFAVVYAASEADVVATVTTCRAQNVCVTVRSSGHNNAGWSELNHRVVIDVSRINGTKWLPSAGLFAVGPGTNLAELTAATKHYGVAGTWGDCPGVRLGGYLQGGGEGFLQHWAGMGADRVAQMSLVLPNGSAVSVTETSQPDLFWALRGGGGPAANFGVVTGYQLRLSTPPAIIIWSLTFAAGQDSITAASRALSFITDDTSVSLAFQLDGSVNLNGWWTGTAKTLVSFKEQVSAGLHVTQWSNDTSTVWAGSEQNFEGWGAFPNGSMWVAPATSLYLPPRSQGVKASTLLAMQKHLMQHPELGNHSIFYCEFFIYSGAVTKVPVTATAFAHRNTLGNCECGVFLPPSASHPMVEQVNEWMTAMVRDILLPDFGGADQAQLSVYQNQPSLLLQDPLRAYYGDNLPRLQKIKAAVDPEHFFFSPQSL